LRRHADQAQAAETDLRRRLASAYVVRRLAERPTQAALRPALEALETAGAAWDAGRDRAALGGAEAEDARGALLALAEETARTVDRVRWLVRAALVAHPELTEVVFPRRSRAGDSEPATGADSGPDTLAPAPDGPQAPEPSPLSRPADLVEAVAGRADPAVAAAATTDKGAGTPSARRRNPTGPRPAVSNEPPARGRAAPTASSSGDTSSKARPARRKKPTRSAAPAPHPRPGRGGARS